MILQGRRQQMPAAGGAAVLALAADRLIAAIKAAGVVKVQGDHAATDHGWSDRRLTLQARVINVLAELSGRAPVPTRSRRGGDLASTLRRPG